MINGSYEENVDQVTNALVQENKDKISKARTLTANYLADINTNTEYTEGTNVSRSSAFPGDKRIRLTPDEVRWYDENVVGKFNKIGTERTTYGRGSNKYLMEEEMYQYSSKKYQEA